MRLAFRRERFDQMAALLLLAGCAGFFLARAKQGVRFATFGDETMHFIGAKALLTGDILYRDFIELHGPLAYAIPQAYFAVFRQGEPLHARVIPMIFTICAALAVAYSGCLRGNWERIVAAAIFLGLTTTVWIVQGLCLYDYQPPCGALLLIGLALAVLPAWFDETIGDLQSFVSGVCLGLTPFLAFSYGPPAVLIFASAAWAMLRARRWRSVTLMSAGSLGAVIAMLSWLIRYADLRGYLVFHFMHALADFGPYLHFGLTPSVTVLRISLSREDCAQSLGVLAGAGALTGLMMFGPARARRIIPASLGLAGVVLTNGRGSNGFQDGAFILVTFGLFAIAAAQVPRRAGSNRFGTMRVAWAGTMAMVLVSAEMVSRHARSSPHGLLRRDVAKLPPASLTPSQAYWAQKVRAVTQPAERILAVPFEPDIYALAGRLPMKRYVYYLPWDADYAKHPRLGLDRNLCVDLGRNPPPVIYYNGWVVWNKWDPKNYMACLSPFLAEHYRHMPGETYFYVRSDRVSLLKP